MFSGDKDTTKVRQTILTLDKSPPPTLSQTILTLSKSPSTAAVDLSAPIMLPPLLHTVNKGNLRTGTKVDVIRQAISKHLSNTTEYQTNQISTHLSRKQNKLWQPYRLHETNITESVFSDVCYEYSAQTKSFIFKHIFKTGEDKIYNKQIGVEVGQGGRHSVLHEGIASVTSPKSEWSHPATEGQDLLVLELLDYKMNGFYIDLAARYWHRGSNSFYLETYYNYNGICIEPDNNFARGLVLNRTCLVICNNPISDKSDTPVQFNYKINGNNNKGNENNIKITTTLTSILKSSHSPKIIDYLSLDVEDHEYSVLQHFDFKNYQFLVLTIERPIQSLHVLLTKYNYYWLTQLKGNFGETVYIHKSLPGFNEKMYKYRTTASHKWRNVPHQYMMKPVWNNTTRTCKYFLDVIFII